MKKTAILTLLSVLFTLGLSAMEKDYNDYQSKRDDAITDYNTTDLRAELKKLDDQARKLMPNIIYIEIDSSAAKADFKKRAEKCLLAGMCTVVSHITLCRNLKIENTYRDYVNKANNRGQEPLEMEYIKGYNLRNPATGKLQKVSPHC